MPSIKDFFNRIRDSIFNRNTVLQIDAPKQSERESVKQDLMLKGSLRKDTLDFFEQPLNYNDYCKDFFSISDNFAKQYQQLIEEAKNMTDETIKSVTDKTIEETKKLIDFKTAGAEGIKECKIRSIILPLLADHVLREANHYFRILKN